MSYDLIFRSVDDGVHAEGVGCVSATQLARSELLRDLASSAQGPWGAPFSASMFQKWQSHVDGDTFNPLTERGVVDAAELWQVRAENMLVLLTCIKTQPRTDSIFSALVVYDHAACCLADTCHFAVQSRAGGRVHSRRGDLR
jgi:hypothetical protein